MKIRTIISATALLCAIGMAPAFAQTAQQDLEQYVNSHPELKANPSLMNDPRYLANHPDLNHFLETHPQVDRARYGHSGAYDQHHHWRRASWWHEHDPRWVQTNHPDWNKNHPEWVEEHRMGTPEHPVGAPAYHAGNPEYHPAGNPAYHPNGNPEYHTAGNPAYHPAGNPEYHPNGANEYHPNGTPEHPMGAPVPPPPHHYHQPPNG
jgi:hypothetical protein